jgi:hypothetical protein
MRKTRTRLLAAAGSMLAAGAIAVSGIVAAAAAPHTAQSRGAGIEHFQAMSTDPTGAETTVIARGVFTAGAVDIETSNTTDTFKFPNGTIRLRHSEPVGPANFNPRTCLGTVNQHGTYKLLGGTGKYAGISGHGTFRLHLLFVAARSHGKCSDTKPPVAFELLIRASGPVHL